jgi:hypothetical protein
MPVRRSGQPRPWIYAWLLLLVPVWGVGLRDSARMLQWAGSSPSVCNGLGGYAALAGAVPPEATLGFVTDAAEPAASERFFCAQLALAPRVLVRWWTPEVQGRSLPGTVVMAHFDDRAALEAFLRSLEAEAARQGTGLQRTELVPGVLLIRVGKG